MAGVRTRPNGRGGKYQGWFVDHTGRRRFFLGTHSRRDTLKMAERLEDEARQVHLGYRPPPTAASRHRSRPFMETVKEYVEWGRTFGRRDGKPWTPETADRKANGLAKWAETLSIETLADLDGILPRVEAVLRELAGAGFSGNTLKHHAKALTSFCNWCVGHGYLVVNPLKGLAAIDTTPRTERRALTAEEISPSCSLSPRHGGS